MTIRALERAGVALVLSLILGCASLSPASLVQPVIPLADCWGITYQVDAQVPPRLRHAARRAVEYWTRELSDDLRGPGLGVLIEVPPQASPHELMDARVTIHVTPPEGERARDAGPNPADPTRRLLVRPLGDGRVGAWRHDEVVDSGAVCPSGQIVLAPEVWRWTPAAQENLLRHEIGHVLGLEYHRPRGIGTPAHVMQRSLWRSSPDVLDADLEDIRQLRSARKRAVSEGGD
jgi:hypothetical protein